MDEPIRLGAAALAGHIARGELSATEAVAAHVARIEATHGRINAVVVPRFAAALAEAAEIDAARARGEPLGPLAGVPITIKECIDLRGTPSTFGLPTRKDTLAAHDAPLVQRLRAAGAIVLGKTNVAQLLLYSESDNPLYGRTANPWALDRAAGGASGGEGAIVAACGSPLGLGTDIGGSVRIPGHFCGVAAFKPSTGALPMAGTGGLYSGQDGVPDNAGPLAREVADLALALGVLRGSPVRSIDVRGLRVGVYDHDGLESASPALRRAVAVAADALRGRGVEVVPWTPPHLPAIDALLGAFLFHDRGRGLVELARGNPLVPQNQGLLRLSSAPLALSGVAGFVLERLGREHMARLVRTPIPRRPADVGRNHARLVMLRRAFFAVMHEARLDALLCPPYPTPAIPHRASERLTPVQTYASVFNVLGAPAGVVPVTRVRPGEESDRARSSDRVEERLREAEAGSAGLPVAAQLAAAPGDDDRVLALMAALESALSGNADRPRWAPL
jgi:fatty acid amide hydrolase